jgi:hypothetical protein
LQDGYFDELILLLSSNTFQNTAKACLPKILLEILKVVKATEPIYNASTILAGEYESI